MAEALKLIPALAVRTNEVDAERVDIRLTRLDRNFPMALDAYPIHSGPERSEGQKMNDRTNPAESKAAHIGGWYVEVAANGERVLCISDDDVTGIDDMEPFAPIVRTAAAHLINFVGAGPSYVGALVALAHTSSDTRPTDDELWDQTLSERDTYHEYADKLANAIATHLGVDIGEHSNLNNPWSKALEAIESRSTAMAAEAVAWDFRMISSDAPGEWHRCASKAHADELRKPDYAGVIEVRDLFAAPLPAQADARVGNKSEGK